MVDEIKISVFLLRLAMGILFIYSAITKFMDPQWTAATYITDAHTFHSMYQWMIAPERIGIINLLSKWGELLIGISLITGMTVRIASVSGIIMMLLYYFPVLQFPYAGQHGYIVDEHIIYALMFFFFLQVNASDYFGLGGLIHRKTKIGDQKWVAIFVR